MVVAAWQCRRAIWCCSGPVYCWWV